MDLQIRPFLLKPQWMNGLSERLLVSHYVNNYGGALRRLNAIRARLASIDWTQAPTFEINGLKREELIASASVILHEIYFESLGGYGDNPPTGVEEPPVELARALERDFGSVREWRAEFVAMAKALAGGSGWAILAWSERLGRLVNHWAADHAHNLPASVPILAIDMYEHAYHLDFGA
jgi:Fe-Mn family superoxide dismutase